MPDEAYDDGLIGSLARSFRSAVVTGCFLTLALLLLLPIDEVRRQEDRIPLVSKTPQGSVEGSVQGGTPNPYPMWRIPPRFHRFEEPDTGPVRVPDVWPVLVRSFPPRYPEEARRGRISGIVLLEVVIETDGKASRGRVLKPLPFGLTDSAIEAVGQWRWRPGKLKGKPVPTVMHVIVTFSWPPRNEPRK